MSLVSDGATLFATPFVNSNTSLSALTLFCWVKYPTSTTGAFDLFGFHNTTGIGANALVKFNSSNVNGGGITDNSSNFLFAVETGFGPEANTWEPLCCVVANNGTVTFMTPRVSTTNTTSSGAVSTSTWNQIQILGDQSNNATAAGFLPSGGMLAECAIWQTALAVDEQQALVFGQVSPMRVRPMSLLCYLPLRFDMQDYGPLHLPFASTAGGTAATYFSGDHPIYGGPRLFQHTPLFKLGSSTQHGLALSAASADTAGLMRKPALPRGVGSAQHAARTAVPARSFRVADANVAAVGLLRSRHAVYSAANAEAAAVVRVYHHGLLPSAASANVAFLAPIGRVYPSVVAASNASIALLYKIINKPFTIAEGESAFLNRGFSKGYSAADPNAAGLQRSAGLRRGVAAVASTSVGRSLVKRLATLSGQAVNRLLVQGKHLAVAAAEFVILNRARPFHLSVASAETAAMSTAGGKQFFRLFPVAATQIGLLVRGQAARRGAVDAQVAFLARLLGKGAAASDGQSTSVAKQAGRSLFAIDASVVALVRQLGVVKRVASGSVASVMVAILHHLAVLAAAMAQVAARSGAPGRWKALSASDANVASMALHATHTIQEALSAASGQAIGLLKSVGRLLSVAASQVIAVRKGVIRPALAIASVQVVLALKTLGKAFTVASGESALAAERHAIPSVHAAVSAQATFLSPAINRVLGLASAQMQAMRRGIAKMLPLAFVMHVASGKGGFKAFATSSPNSAEIWTPHGKILGAVNVQVPAVRSWYHLFVPQWAAQQQTYLPPFGGPAEPPTFGAIDPADQTTFAFDWSRRIGVNDAIVSATVTSVPPGLSFAGPVFVQGTLVQATVAPFTPLFLPTIYSLRCSVVTASGRRSSFSIPVPVRSL